MVDGRFAIATTRTALETLQDRIYLERCGSGLRMRIPLIAQFSVVAANLHAVVWESTNNTNPARFTGVLLPSLRRFSFRFPHRLADDQVAYGLGELRMYVRDDQGRVWVGRAPVPPCNVLTATSSSPRV